MHVLSITGTPRRRTVTRSTLAAEESPPDSPGRLPHELLTLARPRIAYVAAAPDDSTGTALVLGGGGSIGNAWLIGVVAGLADGRRGRDHGRPRGRHVSRCHRRGAAHRAPDPTGSSPTSVSAAAPSPPSRTDTVARPASRPPAIDHQERTARIIAAGGGRPGHATPPRGRSARAGGVGRLVGTMARHRRRQAARRSLARAPAAHHRVDARTGEPVVLDRDSGVDLVDAVAASCSSGCAYGIGDDRYLDGGYRTNADNADLAAGHDAGAGPLALRRPVAHARRTGACTSRTRSRSCAPTAPTSRRCSRTAHRSTRSATT